MPRTAAQLDADIAAFLSRSGDAGILASQAASIKREIESKTDATVNIESSGAGGYRILVDDPVSGHNETFGVSRYGVTPGSVRFGSGLAAGRFIKTLRSAVKKADAMTPKSPKSPKAPRAKPTTGTKSKLDLSILPGTPGDQRKLAGKMIGRREKPIRIEHAGPSDWRIVVLGTNIGSVTTKELAQSAAHQVGRYRLELGDFASTYVEGW